MSLAPFPPIPVPAKHASPLFGPAPPTPGHISPISLPHFPPPFPLPPRSRPPVRLPVSRHFPLLCQPSRHIASPAPALRHTSIDHQPPQFNMDLTLVSLSGRFCHYTADTDNYPSDPTTLLKLPITNQCS